MPIPRPSLPGPGDRLPAVVLETVGGRRVDVRRSGHDSIVLVFCHPGCERCRAYLGEIGQDPCELSVWDSVPVAVVTDREEARATAALTSPPVLVDPGGHARRGAGVAAEGAAVLVADRYGTVYRAEAVSGDHAFPTHEDLVAEARYIAIQCPECSVPDLSGGWGR